MVTRSQVMCTLASLVIVCVIIQFWFAYSHISMHPIDVARAKSRAYVTVKKFIQLGNELQISLILVDPHILNEIVTESFEDAARPCRFLCKNHVYTFALLDSDYDDFKLALLPKLHTDGFKIQATYKSGSTGNIGEVPTHIHIRDHVNHAVHVVIFHKRHKFWWYGPDPDDEFKLDIRFTHQQGALDMFEYAEAPIDGIEVIMPHYPKKFLDAYKQSKFIPCNQTRADEFHHLYPRDLSKNATEFRELAVRVIQVMKRRLDDFEVPFWLSSGTLLGWFRQCDIIPYSLDVDLGVFIKDHPPTLLKMLKSTGMQLEHKFGKIEDSLQYAFDMDKIKLDIFFFYEDKQTGKVWNGGTDYNSGAKYRYTFDKFTLCWTEFYGMKVRVPCETEAYIQANYGHKWFHPIKSWDWKSSPSNVEEVASWKDDELDDVIQLYDKKGKRIYLEWDTVNDNNNKKEL